MVKRGFLIAAGVLCFVLAGYFIYLMVRPSGDYGPELPPVRMQLAEACVPRAVGEVRSRLPGTFFGAVLLHFQGHRNAHDIRKMVEDEFVKSKKLRLYELEELAEQEKEESESWLQKGKDWLGRFTGTLGMSETKPPDRMKKVLETAGVHGFVGAEVNFIEDSSSEERLDLTIFVKDLDGKQLFRETYTESMKKSLFDLEYYRIKIAEIGMGWKLLMWLVFTLALPVVTFFVPAKAMKTESNGVIMGSLVGYTVADGFMALALMGFAVGGILSFFLLLVSLGLAGVYNYGIFTEIKDFV